MVEISDARPPASENKAVGQGAAPPAVKAIRVILPGDVVCGGRYLGLDVRMGTPGNPERATVRKIKVGFPVHGSLFTMHGFGLEASKGARIHPEDLAAIHLAEGLSDADLGPAPVIHKRATFAFGTEGGLAPERYRMTLERAWGPRPWLLWVMLNPSSADAECDDPTVRRCIGYARREKFGGVVVVNLFARIATHPKKLYEAGDPVGPGNDAVILREAAEAPTIVLAWGSAVGLGPKAKHPILRGRGAHVIELLRALPHAPVLACLGVSKGNQPWHPLMVPAACPLIHYPLPLRGPSGR
jgi:hypothetical protein